MSTTATLPTEATATAKPELRTPDRRTSDDFREIFANHPEFNDNKAIVAHIEQTGEVVRVTVIQQKEIVRPQTGLLAMAMGWKNANKFLVRAWQNFNPDVFAKLEIKIGDPITTVFQNLVKQEGLDTEITEINVLVEDNLIPDTWVDNTTGLSVMQNPLTTSNGNALTCKGAFIYRHTSLGTQDEKDVYITPDKIIKVVE